MTPVYILIIGVILIVGNYISKHWRKWWYRNDINVPAPATKRTDLYYGYFGCLFDQVAETWDHVNLLNEAQFEGPERAARNIVAAGVDCMLCLTPQLLQRINGAQNTVRADAQASLFGFFRFLSDAGALKHVKFLTPVDEPNNNMESVEELSKAVVVIKAVAKFFPELDDVKLYAIYASDKDFMGKEMFDLVGFDDYDMKSNVLVGKGYKDLKATLRPHQRTILVPGGCYGQDPTPFVNFAQANQEVAMVLPFLWLDDQWGTVGVPGIRSGSLRSAYVNAGKSIIN